jgi:16S rRNA processing protein RimM
MIKKEECLFLGTLVRPHGTKGAVLILLRDIKAEEIIKRDTVFVVIDGLLVPFFIEEFRISSSDAIIAKFERINDQTAAKSLSGSKVYVLHEQIGKKQKHTSDMIDLKGFTVRDQKTGFTGVAGEINDIVNNPLLQVYKDNKVYYVPLHEDIILKINKKEKTIVIDAPEGLFEL